MGIILGAVAVSTMQYVAAWTPPPAVPPGGNVAAPLTTGNVPQTRNANLSLGSGASLLAGGSVAAPQLCIGGDCRTAWPPTVTNGSCAVGHVVQSISSTGNVTCAPAGAGGSMPFGGMFVTRGGDCRAANHYTGGCSCPPGFWASSMNNMFDHRFLHVCVR